MIDFSKLKNIQIDHDIPNMDIGLLNDHVRREHELQLLGALAANVPEGGRILEIGSFMGRSSKTIAMNTRATVDCIDPWEEHSFEEFLKNTQALENINPIQKRSQDFFLLNEEKYDLVFIDGDHSQQGFAIDFVGALGCLKSGGVMSGHDYCPLFPWISATVNAVAAHTKTRTIISHYLWFFDGLTEALSEDPTLLSKIAALPGLKINI